MAVTDAYKHVFDHVTEAPRNFTIDLAARYAAAFGMKAASKLIDIVFIEEDGNHDYRVLSYPNYNSDFEQIKLEIPGSDMEPLVFGSVLKGANGAVFAAPPIFQVLKQEKNLVTTKVNDDDPVVVERWGTAPWTIELNGFLVDLENHIYPSDEIRRLNRFWKQNAIVEVAGTQFEELDIDAIVLKEINFGRQIGFSDSLTYTLKAQSIKSVNFTLLKPNG